MYFWYKFCTYLFYPFASVYLYFRKLRKKVKPIASEKTRISPLASGTILFSTLTLPILERSKNLILFEI